MATLPGLNKGVTKDPTPPAVDTEVSPITIPDGTTLVTTKTTNETIDNVDQLIDYVSGDNSPNFIPQSAIDTLVIDLAAKEDTANKGAVSGYAALDASQLLLLSNFPSGTALQVLRRNVGNTALEFADPAAAEVFTWTADHDADTNDLLNMKQLTFVNDTAPDTTLASLYSQNEGNISINTPTSKSLFVRVNGSQEYTFSSTQADFNGNNLVDLGTVTMTTAADIENLDQLRFAGTNSTPAVGDIAIWANGNSMRFNVPSGESFRMGVNGNEEYEFTNTQLIMSSNNLDFSTGIIQWAAGESIGIESNNMVFDVTSGDSFSFDIAGTPEYTFNSSEANFNGNKLRMGTGIIQFNSSARVIQLDGSNLALKTLSGTSIELRVNNVVEFEFDTASGFVSFRRIQGNQGADIVGAATITLGNGNYFDITGTTNIDFMTITDWQAGAIVTLQFDASSGVNDNTASPPVNTVPFALAGNFTASAGDTITVILDGAFWREISRSVN